MPVGDCLGGDPGRYGNGATAGIESGPYAISLQECADARPAGPSAVGEVALHAQIRQALDFLDGLVDVLIALITA